MGVEQVLGAGVAVLDHFADLAVDRLRSLVGHLARAVDRIAEEHLFVGLGNCSGPSASDMPQRVTMSRAS